MRSGGIDGSSMPRSGRVALVQHPPVWHCWMSSTGEAMTTAGLDTQPSASTYDLEDLVSQAWRGGIRVPHFQRDFRWGTEDVIRLFDSIVKGYPIGSLLLWVRRSPAARVTLGALEIDAPASDG